MKLKNIAVVGSNGFIGRHLTEKLNQIRGVSLFLFGKSDTCAYPTGLPYKKIDLLDTEQINEQFARMDLVYYLASETIPANSWEKPQTEIEKNLLPFIHFTECIARLGIKKIVFLSSAGTIYGPARDQITEDSNKKPFSPYGITKLTMEYFLNYFEVKYKLAHDIYRVSNVYGQGQDTSKGLGIINTFLEKIISDRKINIFGDGENIRNYIYVKDVAELLSYSVLSESDISSTYNLSSGDTLKINELVHLMKNIVQEEFDVQYTPTRQSDNSFINLDNTRITTAYKNFKFTSIEDGIEDTYLFLKQKTVIT